MSSGEKIIGNSLIVGQLFLNTVRPNNNAAPTSEINSMTTAQLAALTFTGASINYNNQDSNLYFCPPALATKIKLTNQLPAIANNTILANTSGSTAIPTAVPVVAPINLSGSGLGINTATTSALGATQLAPDLSVTAGLALQPSDSRIVAITAIPQTTFLGRRFAAGAGVPQSITPSNQFNFSGSTVDLAQPVNNLNGTNAVLVYQIQNDSQVTTTSSLTETNIKTLVIQAGTLFGLVDDSNLFGNFGGTFTVALATTGNIRVYINNVLICDNFISTIAPSGSWTCDYQIMRSSATNIRCQATIRTCVAGTPAVVFCGTVNVAFNPSLAVNAQVRALVSVGSNAINCSLGTMSGSKNI
jgi:hypothetical protein